MSAGEIGSGVGTEDLDGLATAGSGCGGGRTRCYCVDCVGLVVFGG
jgi:hypothetical protein